MIKKKLALVSILALVLSLSSCSKDKIEDGLITIADTASEVAELAVDSSVVYSDDYSKLSVDNAEAPTAITTTITEFKAPDGGRLKISEASEVAYGSSAITVIYNDLSYVFGSDGLCRKVSVGDKFETKGGAWKTVYAATAFDVDVAGVKFGTISLRFEAEKSISVSGEVVGGIFFPSETEGFPSAYVDSRFGLKANAGFIIDGGEFPSGEVTLNAKSFNVKYDEHSSSEQHITVAS